MKRVAMLACLLLAACEPATKMSALEGEDSEELAVPAEAELDVAEAAATTAERLSYAAVPSFDARRVCDFYASTFPKSEPHNVDPACYADEIAAKKALSDMRIPESIATYCEQIATGAFQGGYSKFKECVDEKLANEATLSRIEAESGL